MTRTARLLLALLGALLACAGTSCCNLGKESQFNLVSTNQASLDPFSTPPPALSISSHPIERPVSSSLPGDRVVWTTAPIMRVAPSGVGPFLADVESHLPTSLGMQYRDKDRITWCHETTHGVNASLRNKHGLPAFYPGGGRCALVKAPAITIGDVAAVLPLRFRGTRYATYLVSQRRDWDREPLYVWDEWVAYDNGTTTGIEEGRRAGPGSSDDAVACIELSGYALAVAAAARRKGVPVSEQFREFLAWELRRSLALSTRALAMPAFAWSDRRLERLWRGGDVFLVEQLRALYGEKLTVKDLLPDRAALPVARSSPPPGGQPPALLSR